MNDIICRQTAINMLCSKCTVDKPETCSTIQKGDNWCEEVYILQRVPSAQPEIVRCKDCKYNVSSHKCLHPESFFLVPDDDFYCGYAERRTDEHGNNG